MMRYFGVPHNHEILWKRSLTDNEIDQLLEGSFFRRRPQRRPTLAQETPVKPKIVKEIKTQVKRLPIGEDDVCPICYDSLHSCPKDEVAWCSFGCGGNFHVQCVQEWIKSRNANGERGCCPMCRVEYDQPDVTTPREPGRRVIVTVQQSRPPPIEAPQEPELEVIFQGRPYEPSEALREIDAFIASTRATLETEMKILEDQQRRVQAIVDNTSRQRRELQTALIHRGAPLAGTRPVCPIRMPDFFSTSNPSRSELAHHPPPKRNDNRQRQQATRVVEAEPPQQHVPNATFSAPNASPPREPPRQRISIGDAPRAQVRTTDNVQLTIPNPMANVPQQMRTIIHSTQHIIDNALINQAHSYGSDMPTIRGNRFDSDPIPDLPHAHFANQPGNVSDAMTQMEIQRANERRIQNALTNRVTMTPVRKSRPKLKPKNLSTPTSQQASQPLCVGWSS